jgi:hypothetical protein
MALAKLKITKTDGEVSEHDISPLVQYKFEKKEKKSVATIDSQTDMYQLAWFCLQVAGETIPPFGEDFVATLDKVEVVDGDPL